MILDTTFLIDVMRGDPDALAKAGRLEASGVPLWVPTPVLFELAEGFERADRADDERRLVAGLLDDYTVLGLGAAHALRAGEISGRLIRHGNMIDPIDAQIAGIASHERLPVVTRNQRHFARVEGLAIESY